jgi:hypothetical protein
MGTLGRRQLLKGSIGVVGGFAIDALLRGTRTEVWAADTGTSGPGASLPSGGADWYTKPQIYGMLPLRPEDAQALGLTFNGLWGGYFWDTPIRQGDFLYGSDSEHVAAMHQAGLRTGGVIDSAGAYDPLLARYTELQGTIEMRADGTPAVYQTETNYSFMCLHDPRWLNWQIDEGKRIIDAGADIITLDNCVPLGRAILLGSLTLPGGTAGFSDRALEAFRAYVKPMLPQVQDLSAAEIRSRLLASEPYLYGLTTTKDELLDHFFAFYDEASYSHMRTLVGALRAHAQLQNRTVPIVGNWSLTGVRLGAAGEYALDSSRYWPLLDMFASEYRYSIAGDDDSLTPMPRQKMVSLYKLAWALKATPSIFLPMAGTRLMSETLFRLPNFYFIQMAEAYAHRQNMVVYAYPGDQANLDFGRKLTPLTTLVTQHHEVYEQARTTYADAALVLFRADAYTAFSGLAQALAESNVQFDTLVAFDEVGLTAARLAPYPTTAVTTLEGASRDNITVLNDYVRGGGRLVIFGAETDPDLLTHARVMRAGTDLGSAYLSSYQNTTRGKIRQLVLGRATPQVKLNQDLRKVVATAYTGAGVMMVHLVNYDHRFSDDRVTDQINLLVTIRQPANASYRLATMHSPDSGLPLATEQSVTSRAITIKVPRLRRYTVLVLRQS